MKEVSVELPPRGSGGYKIHVGTGAISRIGSLFDLGRYTRIVLVTDEGIPRSLHGKVEAALPGAVTVTLKTGEDNKGADSVKKIWQALYDAACDRGSLVVNLGGGVVGDVGGFAASTYMRGIDFLNIPTTLLSQADSSIGGKTGINFAGIKNLVGTFSQPIGVVIDPQTLGTLPKRELVSGFAEIIKHGLISDADYFRKATSKRPADFTPEEMEDIIAGSCRVKASIVHSDETETGKRKLLNFGHTVGHAIEALSHEAGKPLSHGEAISIGMVAEADMAVSTGLLGKDDADQVRQSLEHAGLPVSFSGLSADDISAKMRADKKNTGGKLNFTLIDRIGHALYDQEVPETAIAEALRTVSA